MSPCDVNGINANHVFKYLRMNTKELGNGLPGLARQVPWNFAKWLVDKDGKVILYLDPSKKVLDYSEEISNLLINRTKRVLTKEEKEKLIQQNVIALTQKIDEAIALNLS